MLNFANYIKSYEKLKIRRGVALHPTEKWLYFKFKLEDYSLYHVYYASWKRRVIHIGWLRRKPPACESPRFIGSE